MKLRFGWVLFLFMLPVSCLRVEQSAVNSAPPAKQTISPPADLQESMKAVEAFFKPMTKHGPDDWLASHTESGQTFEEYLNENPTLPTVERNAIYIQPLGTFTSKQNRIIRSTAEGLEAFYGLPVNMLPTKTFAPKLADKDFRIHGYPIRRQIKTGYILNEILAPALPRNAAALIALTSEDLFPDDSMNFVFGQASFDARVGVWSLFRLAEDADPKTFLLRTVKIAAHETGHMFSIRHCTKYECVMSGSNHIVETDSHPLDACPECMAKIAWLSHVAPVERYKTLAAFCRRHGLKTEADEFERKAAAL